MLVLALKQGERIYIGHQAVLELVRLSDRQAHFALHLSTPAEVWLSEGTHPAVANLGECIWTGDGVVALTRRKRQSFWVDVVHAAVVHVGRSKARVGFSASDDIIVDRERVYHLKRGSACDSEKVCGIGTGVP